ncbi:bleomycin resistance protein [Microvirga pudoricolor]|uniref:bleomycin resistance protein n=1 Tax=Microvirga pudoricolor TaxID=2778729 RepID=UPI001951671D|nr:VOC family protein [Microvirga pudoricolor]MBM6596287.1 VOC family protein [Microvirga pudoricolor]
MSDSRRPRLVPELLVTDLEASLGFWRDALGFRVVYERPEHGFASIDLDGAVLMLEQRDKAARTWETGPLDHPLGRGINFEIAVADLDAILARLEAKDWPLYMAPEARWYRVDRHETGQRQFLVQDPDGYLLRLAQSLGTRPIPLA